ncbi:MAG: hypothetical protein EA377_13045 [Phycisphaerales bacterium]|nr:MAG: hypothetical protein EA377_13045 [Phycisphaerales bacterium]
MNQYAIDCPATKSQVVDLYFMEHRAKLLDIAAFLDRYDRAPSDDDAAAGEDFRIAALRDALRILSEDGPERARRIQEHFSDMTEQPIEKAPMQGALGVPPASNA